MILQDYISRRVQIAPSRTDHRAGRDTTALNTHRDERVGNCDEHACDNEASGRGIYCDERTARRANARAGAVRISIAL